MMISGRTFTLVHVAFWIAVALYVYATARPMTFATCWTLFVAFNPVVGLALLAGTVGSFGLVVFGSLKVRSSRTYVAAKQFLVLICGLSGSVFAAGLAVPRPNCL